MTTRDIVKNLRTPGKEPWLRALRPAAFFILCKRGYHVQHIATAFNVNYYTVQRARERMEGYIEVGDKIAIRAMEIMQTHIIDLIPYFEGETKKIRTYVKIDNIKL